jgi:hypothetical protein
MNPTAFSQQNPQLQSIFSTNPLSFSR